ncbi:glycosyltransferase family 4 protein [Rhodovibrionaceae bacterium A322]
MADNKPQSLLLTTLCFPPHVGGMETMVDGLAARFTEAGYEVEVITTSTRQDGKKRDFKVTRGVGFFQVWRAFRSADLVVLNQVGLKFAWPLFFLRRPTYVIHHNALPPIERGRILASWIKREIARRSSNIAISRFIAGKLPFPSRLIHSAYRDDVFNNRQEARPADLGFSGRIVPVKGLMVLIEALVELRKRGKKPTLWIAGEGAQWPLVEQRIEAEGLTDQVTYLNTQTPEELNDRMNQTKVMVVPSTYEEPLGLVPVEAMACGSAVVASRVGGLPEAVGQAGILVPPDDPKALADACQDLLASKEKRQELLQSAETQCAKFRLSAIASDYLALFAEDSSRNRHDG